MMGTLQTNKQSRFGTSEYRAGRQWLCIETHTITTEHSAASCSSKITPGYNHRYATTANSNIHQCNRLQFNNNLNMFSTQTKTLPTAPLLHKQLMEADLRLQRTDGTAARQVYQRAHRNYQQVKLHLCYN